MRTRRDEGVRQVTQRARLTRSSRSLTARMPSPSVYERECQFWPWASLLDKAAALVIPHLKRGDTIIDYMCGTGYFLSKLPAGKASRMIGVDADPSYVRYGKRRYHLDLVCNDALTYRPKHRANVIVCTAGIHHVTRIRQRELLDKIHDELSDDGLFVVGEELVPPFRGERARRLAVNKLFSNIIKTVVAKDPEPDVLEASLTVLENDLLERGEWKFSLPALKKMLKQRFQIRSMYRIWPSSAANYGDFIFVCTKRLPKSHQKGPASR